MQKGRALPDLFMHANRDYLPAASASCSAAYSAQARLSPRSSSASESATVWRASTASEACSASFTTDLKYQQALALTRAAGRHLRAGSPDALVVDHRQIDVPQGDLFRRAAEVNRAVSARGGNDDAVFGQRDHQFADKAGVGFQSGGEGGARRTHALLLSYGDAKDHLQRCRKAKI